MADNTVFLRRNAVLFDERGSVSGVDLEVEHCDTVYKMRVDAQCAIPAEHAWLLDEPGMARIVKQTRRLVRHFENDPKKTVSPAEVLRQWREFIERDPKNGWAWVRHHCDQYTTYWSRTENGGRNEENPSDEQIEAAAAAWAKNFYAPNGNCIPDMETV